MRALNFITLTRKKCLYIAEGYCNDGEEDYCLYWLIVSQMSNKERVYCGS